MKIRTKTGEVIDLMEIRADSDHVLANQLSYSPGQVRCSREKLALAIALEAALSVLITIGPQGTKEAIAYDNGLHDGITMIRQAIGMEE